LNLIVALVVYYSVAYYINEGLGLVFVVLLSIVKEALWDEFLGLGDPDPLDHFVAVFPVFILFLIFLKYF
jgi:hypothetical protein